MQPAKHEQGKSKLQVKHNHKQNIALALYKHNAKVNQRGETPPLVQQVHYYYLA